MIAKDFAFHGILTANKRSEFRDHGRARAGERRRRDNPDETGTRGPGARTRSRREDGPLLLAVLIAVTTAITSR
jgi:hypothetical protein